MTVEVGRQPMEDVSKAGGMISGIERSIKNGQRDQLKGKGQ